MKLVISHPELAPELVFALNQSDCLAARIGRNTLEVFVPWLRDAGEEQAAMELLFFVRAWASNRPEFRAALHYPG
jgi:hypothetical protein